MRRIIASTPCLRASRSQALSGYGVHEKASHRRPCNLRGASTVRAHHLDIEPGAAGHRGLSRLFAALLQSEAIYEQRPDGTPPRSPSCRVPSDQALPVLRQRVLGNRFGDHGAGNSGTHRDRHAVTDLSPTRRHRRADAPQAALLRGRSENARGHGRDSRGLPQR